MYEAMCPRVAGWYCPADGDARRRAISVLGVVT